MCNRDLSIPSHYNGTETTRASFQAGEGENIPSSNLHYLPQVHQPAMPSSCGRIKSLVDDSTPSTSNLLNTSTHLTSNGSNVRAMEAEIVHLHGELHSLRNKEPVYQQQHSSPGNGSTASTSHPSVTDVAPADRISMTAKALESLTELCKMQLMVKQQEKMSKRSPIRKFPTVDNTKTTFEVWYNNVLGILATPEWSKLYDKDTCDIVEKTTESNIQLSNYLYAHLHTSLEPKIQSLMDSKTTELRSQGVEYLCAMIPIYRSRWCTAERSIEIAKFHMLSRTNDQSID